MAVAKHTTSQRDFSAGEVDPSLKRSEDHPIYKSSARQCANFLITDTKKLRNRFGRSALFGDGPRVERVLMSPGNVFHLIFFNNGLTVRTLNGDVAFGQFGFPWTTATIGEITWDVYGLSIYICFPGMQPEVLTWDGVSTWSSAPYQELITPGGQKRTFFYRISPQGVTMQPSATSGAITLTFSQGIAVAGMVGTRFRFCGRQVLVTGFNSSTSLNANVIETLPPGQILSIGSTVGIFNLGDEIIGNTSGATGIVTTSPNQQTINGLQTGPDPKVGDAVTGGTSGATGIVTAVIFLHGGVEATVTVSLNTSTLFTNGETATSTAGWSLSSLAVTAGTLTVQLLQNSGGLVKGFAASETIVGPSGQAATTAVSSTAPQAVSVWDDEVMNAFRGWPASVTIDQGRLVFMNFPAVPSGIGYSALGSFTDLYIPLNSVTPDSAIFEIAPNKSQVLYMVPGMEGSEFIFCDNAIYYVPITVAQPLSGTTGISFNRMTSEGSAVNVQPRPVQEAIVYVSAGRSTMRAITATGAYQRPYEVRPISILHDHLLKTPIAIAAPSATDPNFPERYIYVLNSDGTLAVGKLKIEDGRLQEAPGWVSMSGGGTVNWVSAHAGDVLFTTTYAPGAATPIMITEINDPTQYLDVAIFYNDVPFAMPAPGGKGPLWWLANGTCTVMDQGTRQLGLYNIDANGFLIPQFTGGENLASSQLIVGQAWTATFEPWVAGMEPGQDLEQRMTERGISKVVLAFENSTGFVWEKLYSRKQHSGGPALGSVVQTRRVPTYNQDDDPTQPPLLREDFELWRPSGREFDPRIAIVKDTAGPLTILEFGSEATV
jgi:hypothetical protein